MYHLVSFKKNNEEGKIICAMTLRKEGLEIHA